MDKYIGRLLDNRYEILEVIGTGGMAVVYKARCHRLNRLVAVKILKDDYLEDEDFRRRFHTESQAVAMLSHPNIVSVYDVSTSLTADYIVMELIEGISLKQYMEKKGVLNWKETLHFAIQIAKALEHAHSRGIVHRDIKPHNVMVLKNGSVKVTDFGIARMMSKGNTLTKEALGSVHYISPEQAKGGRVDSRSDIYSLGVVMYEMMSGRPPYDGESPVAVAIQHINGGAVMPSTLNPNIPGGLEQIIMKAMAQDINARYTSATKMLSDMDEFRKDPTILFDYNTPPLDAVTRMPRPPVVINTPPPRTTAERVAQQSGTGRQRPVAQRQPQRQAPQTGYPRQNPQRRRPPQQEEKSSNAAVIAIIVCALVALVAIGIFMAVLLGNSNASSAPEVKMVEVPQLLGEKLETLPDYGTIEVRLLDRIYDADSEPGTIIIQEPVSGTMVPAGTQVFVTVSLGKEDEPILMENVVDLTEQRAREILRNLNLGLKVTIQEEFHDEIPVGNVIRTIPEVNTELTSGQEVVLVLSKGPEVQTKKMPNLVGMSVDTAINVLMNYGFPEPEIEMVFANEDQDQVIWQSVERNTEVDITTVIVLKVSKGPEPTEPEESTEPPTTEPPTTAPQEVTKEVVIELPEDYLEDYTVEIYLNGTLVYSETVYGGTPSITVNLTGTGSQIFKICIGGQLYKYQEVDFNSP